MINSFLVEEVLSSREKPGLGGRFQSPQNKRRGSQGSCCSETKKNAVPEKALVFSSGDQLLPLKMKTRLPKIKAGSPNMRTWTSNCSSR